MYVKQLIVIIILCLANIGWAQSNSCLLAHYKLDNNPADSSVNANHGIIKGNPTVVTGFDGTPNGAYHFDGIDDYIVAVNNDVNFAVNDTFSISLWVKPDALQNTTDVTNNDILAKWEDYGGGNEGYPFSIRYYNQTSTSNGKMSAMRFDKNCNNFPKLNGTSVLNNGLYHHIVFVRENGKIKIYVDGIMEDATYDITSCKTSNNDSLYIARRGYTYNKTFFAGTIDDIRIFGCALDSAAVDSLFNWNKPNKPKITTSSKIICKGDSVLLTSGVTYNNFWSTGDTTQSIWVGAGTYSLYINRGGGNVSDTTFITIKAVSLRVTPIDTTICKGEIVDLEVTDGISYLWSTGDTSNIITVQPSQTTVYYVKDVVSGCNDSVVVNVISIPDANFTANPTSGTDTLTVQFSNQTVGATSYFWDFGDGQTSTLVNPSHIYYTGLYTVILVATNNLGCTDTAYFYSIEVNDPFRIFIPNTFTPNGDGTNDVWLVKVSGVKELECYVFNRWGELIYETKELPIAWDGTYKGKIVAEGVYTYMINLRDKNSKFHSYKGVIHVFH